MMLSGTLKLPVNGRCPSGDQASPARVRRWFRDAAAAASAPPHKELSSFFQTPIETQDLIHFVISDQVFEGHVSEDLKPVLLSLHLTHQLATCNRVSSTRMLAHWFARVRQSCSPPHPRKSNIVVVSSTNTQEPSRHTHNLNLMQVFTVFTELTANGVVPKHEGIFTKSCNCCALLVFRLVSSTFQKATEEGGWYVCKAWTQHRQVWVTQWTWKYQLSLFVSQKWWEKPGWLSLPCSWEIPRNKFCTGFVMFDSFLSGTMQQQLFFWGTHWPRARGLLLCSPS